MSKPTNKSKLDVYVERIEKNDPHLTTVELLGEGIGDDGAEKLAHALKINTNVTELELEGNNIGPRGAACLAAAFKTSPALLRVLNLNDNRIGLNGVRYLHTALGGSTSLCVLCLGRNQIGDEPVCKATQASRPPLLQR